MLAATQSGFKFIYGIQMKGKVREFLVNISPFRHIQVFNINRNINDTLQLDVNRVKGNINAINIANKFGFPKILYPFGSFSKRSFEEGERVFTGIKNHKSEIDKQNKDVERKNNSLIDRFSFQAFNQEDRDNYNPDKCDVSKENTKSRIFAINKIIKQISQPPFKNESNQGGDGSCSEGYNELCEEILNIHNATSKGFCQSPSSPFHYSPAGVAKKQRRCREDDKKRVSCQDCSK